MLNCSFVGVIRPTLFYTGIGQTPCSYEHYLVKNEKNAVSQQTTWLSLLRHGLHVVLCT